MFLGPHSQCWGHVPLIKRNKILHVQEMGSKVIGMKLCRIQLRNSGQEYDSEPTVSNRWCTYGSMDNGTWSLHIEGWKQEARTRQTHKKNHGPLHPKPLTYLRCGHTALECRFLCQKSASNKALNTSNYVALTYSR